MASTYSAYAYYVNGWCHGCGRKRNRDGSCANCDRWYNSPLITAGGPLLIATITLLAVGIHMLRPPVAPRPLSVPAAMLPVAQNAVSAPRTRVAPFIAVPAGFTSALPPMNLPVAPAVPVGGGYSYDYNAQKANMERQQREQAQFMQLEELRLSVANADNAVRADDALQIARNARATWQQQSGPAITDAGETASISQFAPGLPAAGNSAAIEHVF